MMTWRDGRRKLRLKHQRFMLTLDRQLSAVLTGAGGQVSAASSSETLAAQPQAAGMPVPLKDGIAGPDPIAASQAGAGELGAAPASVSGGDAITVNDGRRRRARSASGCLEGTSAAEHDAEQYGIGQPRPASAPSVLQQAVETVEAAASAQHAAGVAWLPAPDLPPAAAASAGRSAEVSSVDPASGSANVAHIISSFGRPAWGATEVRRRKK